MTSHRKIWTPPNVNRGGWKEGDAPDVADLSDAIAGPDSRYQTHGPGCGCGDLDCPWYRGEAVSRYYHNLPSREKRRLASEVWDAFRSPEGWRYANLQALAQAMRRPRLRRWRFR